MEFMNIKSSRGQENIDKLPFFLNNSGSPKSWFLLLEAKYEFSAMSSSNKFYQAISGLPPDTLKLLSDDLVEASISCSPYNCLKDLVIDHYKVKPDELICSYFDKNFLNDMKPSEFLNKAICQLESKHPGIVKSNDKKMRQLFISRLPSDVQKIVNGITNIELTKLADFADKLFDKKPVKPAEIVDDKLTISTLTHEVSSLKSQVQDLQEKFTQLERKLSQKPNKSSQKSFMQNSRPSSPKGSSESKTSYNDLIIFESKYYSDKNSKESKSYNDKNLNESKSHLTDKSKLCYYHVKYGAGALKCHLGCCFQPKPQGLKVSNICIYHARNSTDPSQCLPGCTNYSR